MKRAKRDVQIKKAFDDSKVHNDARRIQVDLAEHGRKAYVKTIRNSMERQGLLAKAARKFKVTINSKHSLPVAPNLLGQDFSTTGPNQKFVGEISYLMTSEGWLYLAVIIDLYSRAVIGWSMSTHMIADLVCDALKMALFRRGFPQKVIVAANIVRMITVTWLKTPIGLEHEL